MNFTFYKWQEQRPDWKNLSGNNSKRTLVMLSKEVSGTSLPLLRKILRSVGLDFDEDVHFLPLQTDTTFTLLSDPQLEVYDTVLLFGIPPQVLSIPANLNEGCHCLYYEKITCVFAPSMERLEEKPEFKRPLWNILKHLYTSQPENA